MTAAPDLAPTARRTRSAWWGFARHYAEMVVAMMLGMALYPVWALATDDVPSTHWALRADVECLVMATAMSVPMVAWMVVRSHGPRPTVEMVVAMYAGFVVLFPLLWAGALDGMDVMMAGHVLMPLFMLAAMLLRRDEYLHHRC